MSDSPPRRSSPWPRLAIIAALQAPAVLIALLAPPPASLWIAGLCGSAVCAGGTDSGWRWLNRLLLLVAVCWLLLPLILAL